MTPVEQFRRDKTKEFLLRYKKQWKKIRRLQGRIRVIEDLATNITIDPSIEKIDHTKNPDMIGDLVTKKVDLEAQIKEMLKEAVDIADDIDNELACLSDTDYDILYGKYIDNESWEEIASKIDRSTRYTISLHDTALRDLESVLIVHRKIT